MNILFLLRSLNVGGLEVVTATLANKFAQEGHSVHVFAFEKRRGLLVDRLVKDVRLTIAGRYRVNNDNVLLLRHILIKNDIDVVVNQWGLPLIPIKTLSKARKGLNIKVISVYHNDPFRNGRIGDIDVEIQRTNNCVLRSFLTVKRFVFRCITGFSMRYNYHKSDYYVVLSKGYISHFQKFTKLYKTSKLKVLPNPITVDSSGFRYNADNKECAMIYMGRLDSIQKRIYRVIDVWQQLEQCSHEWHFTLVGDGKERNSLIELVHKKELRHVSFEGYRYPRPYYEKASILLLTSDFEGFPLVLAECMSFGVVPVVYGSFSAVHDIIDDGKNGFIIPPTSKGFDAYSMAEKIQILMNDKAKLDRMAISAIEKSKKFSMGHIYQQWMEIMK